MAGVRVAGRLARWCKSARALALPSTTRQLPPYREAGEIERRGKVQAVRQFPPARVRAARAADASPPALARPAPASAVCTGVGSHGDGEMAGAEKVEAVCCATFGARDRRACARRQSAEVQVARSTGGRSSSVACGRHNTPVGFAQDSRYARRCLFRGRKVGRWRQRTGSPDSTGSGGRWKVKAAAAREARVVRVCGR